MHRIVWIGFALLAGPALAGAQSVAISPAAPHGGEAIAVQFTESFDCTAPTPSLKQQRGHAFTFESVLPYGIVNCAAIPLPMPKYSHFSDDLGPLAAGDYHLTWNMYRAQANGSQQFLWTVSTDFSVAAPNAVAGGIVATIPALQPLTLLLLAGSLGALALHRRRVR